MWQMLVGMAAKKAMGGGKKEPKEKKAIAQPARPSSTRIDDPDSTVRQTEYSSTRLDKPKKTEPYEPSSTRLDDDED